MTKRTVIGRLGCAAAFVLAAYGAQPAAGAECALRHDSLDSAAAIQAAGGTIAGALSFPAGVNATAAAFNGSAAVTYADTRFTAPVGSISFWVRGNSAGTQGGIAEIGVIGTARSLGFFYFGGSHIVFEMRNNASSEAAVWGSGAFSNSTWRHVVASWRDGADGTDMWLFLDGLFVGYSFLPGATTRTATTLRVGATGYYNGGRILLDELRFFDWNLHDGEVYAEYVISSNRHRRQPSPKPVSTGPVRVVDGLLEVHGAPFAVHGVGYQPMPIGMGMSTAAIDFLYSDPAIIARDMPLLRGLHVNTIRTWAPPPDTTLLDALYNNGLDPIYTLIDLWLPPSGLDYTNPAATAPLEGEFAAMVVAFKDHPGLLGWGLGNETNLTISAAQRPHFFAFCDRLAQIAHGIEGATYHPTVLVNGFQFYLGNVDESSDDLSLPNVDIWGQNLYFGEEPHCYFEYYRQLTSKPLIVTEYGIDAWDDVNHQEHPAVQSEYVVRQWRYIEQNALGGMAFEYCDEWWKDISPGTHDFGGYGTHWHPDNYSNEEWWGLVAMADNGASADIATPRQVYWDLSTEYAHAPGDYDADGDVDLADFAAFQRCLGQSATGACGSAFEFTIDGVIMASDLSGFCGELGLRFLN